MSVCVFMPAYNEAGSVAEVIARVKQQAPEADIVVIDDASSDDTAAAARRAGVRVISLPFNLGIGGAVQTGLKYAYRGGYDVAVELDADGQHDPAYIQKLIGGAGEADLVIGSRYVESTEYRASVLRRFGIHLFSYLIKLVTKKRVYDSTSGYRAYSRRSMEYLARRYPADFPEPESIVLALRAGLEVREVPVQMGARQAGESVVGRSDVSWKAVYFVLSNAIAILISSLKRTRAHA